MMLFGIVDPASSMFLLSLHLRHRSRLKIYMEITSLLTPPQGIPRSLACTRIAVPGTGYEKEQEWPCAVSAPEKNVEKHARVKLTSFPGIGLNMSHLFPLPEIDEKGMTNLQG